MIAHESLETPRARSFRPFSLLLTLAALAAPAAGAAPPSCRSTDREACLLEGRFRVRVSFDRADGAREARLLVLEGVGLDTARFSFSAADEADHEDLALRLVDGRTVNGFYWVIASGAEAEAEIEVTDVVTARTRRFVKPEGVRNLRDREAFGAEAQTVSVTLDATRAVRRPIGIEGGTIAVVDAQGTRFQVAFPAQALNLTTDITVTPVATITGLPLSGGLSGAVRIEPEGLVPARTVRLTITPVPAVARAQQATFSFRGLAGEFFLTSPLVPSTPLVVPVHRLGGYGLGVATAADLAAQLLRLPTRDDDRLSQRLAGLLLPARRAGATKVPASVAPLLQQEFAARIQPKLAALKLGQVAKHTRWTLQCPNTAAIPTNTSWVFLYVVAHFDELDENFQFKVNLPPVGVGTILGQRSYQRTVSNVVEDTALILRHDPD